MAKKPRRAAATATADKPKTKPKLNERQKKTLGGIIELADGVVTAAQKKKDPHLDVPARALSNVRFKERKAGYIVAARDQLTRDGRLAVRAVLEGFSDPFSAREWLVDNVLGLGYKEAGHFLRNIGLGEDLAILDRHILKNLAILGVIDEVPTSLTKNRYLEIEKRMIAFSRKVGIPMGHLDLLLWSKETGEIFK